MPDTTTTAVVPDVKGGCNTHCPHGGECSLEPGHETDHQALIAGGRVRCTWPRQVLAASSGCETADLILPWFEVQEGDLVLYAGRMHRLEQMWPLVGLPGSQVGVRLLREGALRDHYVDSDVLTAVRRYVTTTEEG